MSSQSYWSVPHEHWWGDSAHEMESATADVRTTAGRENLQIHVDYKLQWDPSIPHIHKFCMCWSWSSWKQYSEPKLDLAVSKLEIFDTERLCLKSRPTYNQPFTKRNLTLRIYDSCIVFHTSILSWNCPVSIPSFFTLSFDKSDCLLLSPPRVCTFFIYIQTASDLFRCLAIKTSFHSWVSKFRSLSLLHEDEDKSCLKILNIFSFHLENK